MIPMMELRLTPANNAAIEQWTNQPCGALDNSGGSSLAYFEAVERDRYENYAPWMRTFLNFSSYAGKRLLEVGVGQGTDLVQFAKAGADVSGIDITQRHLNLAARNFELRGLHANLQRAAAAAIPFEDDSFDVVYSFGVLHCTDNTVRCLSECHRVLKPGGELILAMYYKYSFFHAYTILVNGILRGKLRKLGYKGLMSLIESGADGVRFVPLVKTYSRRQLRNILEDFRDVRFYVRHLTPNDFGRLRCLVPAAWAERAGRHVGWYLFARAVK
jgi:ubiquinone/menaquinone biosynthesis C-methylase UbiE